MFRLPSDEDTQIKTEEDIGNQTAVIAKQVEEDIEDQTAIITKHIEEDIGNQTAVITKHVEEGEIANSEVNNATETSLPSSSSEM